MPPRTRPRARASVSFSAGAHARPLTGRVDVAISRSNDQPPIEQTDVTGVPLFGHDVSALGPGEAATIEANDFGAPLASLRQLPAGDYGMQPFVNVYTEFKRGEGHTVWLHMDQWEGQDFKRSPGNLYGMRRPARTARAGATEAAVRRLRRFPGRRPGDCAACAG